MSERDPNKPFVDMIRVNDFRQQSLHINELQRRLRVVESRLPSFEALTTQVAASTITQSSNHTHTMNQISDNLHGNLPGIEDDDHPQYAEIAEDESITGVWSFGAVQVNFANGTTYKIEDDGDAYFKTVNSAGNITLDAGANNDVALYLREGTFLKASFWLDASANRILFSTYDSHAFKFSVNSYLIFETGAGAHCYMDVGGYLYIRDQDSADAIRFALNSADGKITTLGGFGAIDVNFANGTTYKVEADGDATFKDVHVLDGAYYYAGTGNDVYLRHVDNNSYLVNNTGSFFIKSDASGSNHMYFESHGSFNFRDLDDGSESLMALNTTTRIFRVGATDGNDDIASSFYGVTKLGSASNYASFAVDGELTLFGTARVKKHITVPVTAARVGSTAPTAAFVGNFAVLQFANTPPAESAYFSFHTPPDWADATDIIIHIHWAPTDGNAGNVVWDMDYKLVASDDDEVISGAGTNATVTDATQSLQDELLESPDFTISGAGIALEDTFGIQISRDTGDEADTYGAAASLVLIEIEYTADKLGEAT